MSHGFYYISISTYAAFDPHVAETMRSELGVRLSKGFRYHSRLFGVRGLSRLNDFCAWKRFRAAVLLDDRREQFGPRRRNGFYVCSEHNRVVCFFFKKLTRKSLNRMTRPASVIQLPRSRLSVFFSFKTNVFRTPQQPDSSSFVARDRFIMLRYLSQSVPYRTSRPPPGPRL